MKKINKAEMSKVMEFGLMSGDRRFWRAVQTATLLVVLGALVGCAVRGRVEVHSVPLSKQSREAIRSVSFNRDVTMPGNLEYTGQAQGVAFIMFGAVGWAIMEPAAQGVKAQLEAAMRESAVDVGQIVREQFAAELAAAGIFPTIAPEGGDAEFKIEVTRVGFVHAPFSTALKPVLSMKATLARRNGSVLWEMGDYVSNSNKETPAHALAEYIETPGLIREALSVASRVVVGRLVKHMRGK